MSAKARHSTHSIAFARQVAQKFLTGETLPGPAKRGGLSRNVWATSMSSSGRLGSGCSVDRGPLRAHPSCAIAKGAKRPGLVAPGAGLRKALTFLQKSAARKREHGGGTQESICLRDNGRTLGDDGRGGIDPRQSDVKTCRLGLSEFARQLHRDASAIRPGGSAAPAGWSGRHRIQSLLTGPPHAPAPGRSRTPRPGGSAGCA